MRSPVRMTFIILALGAMAAPPPAAIACDICAIYTATELQESRTGLQIGIAEQLTRYETRRRDGKEIPNPGERLTSSITQVLLGWNFTPRFGLQLNLPIISRTFRRLEEGRLVRGDESGVGDLSLVGRAVALSRVAETTVLRLSVLGGIKVPTGSSDRLAEELEEAEDDHDAAALGAPARGIFAAGHSAGGEESGVHGHDLALGSGSVDGIIGSELFWSWRRLFVTARGQYAIRGGGDFGYRFANDLTWEAGPGVFVLLGHDHSLALRAVTSGETKGKDEQQGRRLDDTGLTAVFAGPGLAFTWGTALALDVTGDIPAIQHNTAVQILPDWRLRGGISWRF